MNTITVRMTPEAYRLHECCRLLMELAELAQEDAAAALAAATDMRVPVEALELRAAVIGLAEGYLRDEEDRQEWAERLGAV